VGFSLCRNVVV